MGDHNCLLISQFFELVQTGQTVIFDKDINWKENVFFTRKLKQLKLKLKTSPDLDKTPNARSHLRKKEESVLNFFQKFVCFQKLPKCIGLHANKLVKRAAYTYNLSN